MGIGARISQWWRASRAGGDDPESLRADLDAAYRSQVQLLAQVRRGVADVATSRKRVEVQLAGLNQRLAAFDEQAKRAVASGDDAAARDALAQRINLEKAAAELTERHSSLLAEERKLSSSADDVERRIEDFRVRRDTLTARFSAATARTEIQAATTGISAESSKIGSAMSAAERHTRELEAQADAVDEMVAEGVIPGSGETDDELLARRFDELLADQGDGNGPQQISQ